MPKKRRDVIPGSARHPVAIAVSDAVGQWLSEALESDFLYQKINQWIETTTGNPLDSDRIIERVFRTWLHEAPTEHGRPADPYGVWTKNTSTNLKNRKTWLTVVHLGILQRAKFLKVAGRDHYFTIEEAFDIGFGFLNPLTGKPFEDEPPEELPYPEARAIFKEAMGNKTPADFPAIPRLADYLNGAPMNSDEILNVSIALKIPDRYTELLNAYGFSIEQKSAGNSKQNGKTPPKFICI